MMRTLALFLLPACVDAGGKDSGELSLSELADGFVAAHNDARGRAAPTPDPALPDMSWDDNLAGIAQSWGERCLWEHSMGETGENLAFFSYAVEPADVVEAWFEEIAFYDYASNTCQEGQMCGHYTQVVWRDSTRVGCAKVTCEDVGGFGPGDLYVCEYDPPGNWVGEQPY
jgi:pathogenesis-related protein 1